MLNAQNHVILQFAIVENPLSYADARLNKFAIPATEKLMPALVDKLDLLLALFV